MQKQFLVKSANKRRAAFQLLMSAGMAVAITACGNTTKLFPSGRIDTVQRLASPDHMIEAHIPSGQFTILAFEKMHAEGQPAIIYIEGDGNYGGDLGSDPTPADPVALRMASDDANLNVVWLARPCQYADAMGVQACTKDLYTTHRYSPQMLDAMNAALDNIKARYDVPSFSLVGFGGGAAIAVELGAVRKDVANIRTVAGILDTRIMAQDDIKNGKPNPFAGSLNPIDAAPAVAHIPQEHEVAGWDKMRSLAMIQSFEAAEGNPTTAAMGPEVPDQAGGAKGPVPAMMDEAPVEPESQHAPQPLK